jgi:hypothetical protein
MDKIHREIVIENHGNFIRTVDTNVQGYAEERYIPSSQLDSSHQVSSHLSSPSRPDRTCDSPADPTERKVSHISCHETLADECGWQIDRNKFLAQNETHNTQLVITERGFLEKGVIGIVEEVEVKGFEKTLARKRIMLSKANKQRFAIELI